MLLAMASGAAFRQNAELTALSFFLRNWTADVHERERCNWRKVSGYRRRRNDVWSVQTAFPVALLVCLRRNSIRDRQRCADVRNLHMRIIATLSRRMKLAILSTNYRITRLPSNLRHDHPRIRAFSYR